MWYSSSLLVARCILWSRGGSAVDFLARVRERLVLRSLLMRARAVILADWVEGGEVNSVGGGYIEDVG